LRLGERSVFLDLIQTLADGRVIWVVNVDIGAWAWNFGALVLVAVSWVHTSEWNVDGLLNEESTLYVVSLLLVWEVCAGAGVLHVRLFREWSLNIIPPEIDSVCGAIELDGVSSCLAPLSEIRIVKVRFAVVEATCFGEDLLIFTWTGTFDLVFLVLAVGYLGQESGCVSLGIELPSGLLVD
jgi:hypothetical protein